MNDSNSSPDALLADARQFAERGQLAEAERILLRAVKENPERIDLLSHLGYFYVKQLRDRRALAALRKRAQLTAPDAGVCRLLAEVYQRLGDWPNARLWLRRARDMEGADSHGLWLELLTYLFQLRQSLRSSLPRYVRGSGLLRITAQAFKSLLLRIGWAGCWLAEYLRPEWAEVGGDEEAFHLSNYLAWLMRAPGGFPMEAIPYHKCREAIFASRWLPIMDTRAHILDLGSGKNALPVYWAEQGCEVTALDGSPYGFPVLRSLAEASREQGREAQIHFCQSDVTRLPFADGVFDAVSCICMLEHIPEEGDLTAMREIYRVLRHGGMAVITVESAQHPGERWLEVPYEVGYQRNALPTAPPEAFEEVFCRDYSPAQLRERLIETEDWDILAEVYFDDGVLPWRRWLDPLRGSLIAAMMAPLQPLLSLSCYRKASPMRGLTSSSIGAVVLRKP